MTTSDDFVGKRRLSQDIETSHAKKAKKEDHPEESIVILDCGAQYGKVIDRRVREMNVFSDIMPLDSPTEKLKGYKAIIISGGPQSVYGTEAPKYNPELFTLGVPILGICYGMQLLVHVHGGKVEKKDQREDGQFLVDMKRECALFDDCDPTHEVLLTHGDSVEEPLPVGFSTIATAVPSGIISAVGNDDKKMYGVQFHPEVDLTTDGKAMLSNFLFKIAKLKPTYTMKNRKQQAIDEIREKVGDLSVLCLVSGGVDSSVCAALLKAALPADKIHAIHIDLGFMRLNESANVAKALGDVGVDLQVVDAIDTFAHATTYVDGEQTQALSVTINPEHKRKIIGDTYMRVAEEEVRKRGLKAEHVFLAQGTLRPDLIESASILASSNASVIKTHHNDTQLVRELRDQGRIIEPLKDYHKDEVRALGLDLGLPHALVWRQPFPGPGLAIRTICIEEPFSLPTDATTCKKLEAFSTNDINATLLPCRTVGVQGDARSYSNLVCLSCREIPLENVPWDALFELAKKIPKTIHQVNRVIFAFGGLVAERSLSDVTPTRLTTPVVDKLRKADDIVNQLLIEYDLIQKLSQVPVVLFPVTFGTKGNHSVCIRTFITNDFMTGVPAKPGTQIPLEVLKKMSERIIKEVAGISRVCYDLTAKPPATTEWE